MTTAYNTQLDKFHFGLTQSAQNLSKILNELNDEKVTRKAVRFTGERNRLINAVSEAITDQKLRKKMYSLLLHDIHDNFHILVPDKVKTHILNVLTTKLREQLLRR